MRLVRRQNPALFVAKRPVQPGKPHALDNRPVWLPKAAPRYCSPRVPYHRRRHNFGERFTASSFASGDIFSEDVTAGEDLSFARRPSMRWPG